MKTLKLPLYFVAAMLACLLIGVGCSSLLTKQASSTSLPVVTGAATTNDFELLAWERLFQAANAAANPTSTREPIDTIMGAIIALTSGLAGWYGRHHATKSPPTQP